MNGTTKVVLIAAAAAAVGSIVQVWLSNKLSDSVQIPQGLPSGNSGSQWNSPTSSAALQMNPQLETYIGPGHRDSLSGFNGQIYAKRFNKGGNPNAGGNGSTENSWAFQTATKNPYANGTNCTYAKAVTTATQDPTNQATSLVLGPCVAPNNPAQ